MGVWHCALAWVVSRTHSYAKEMADAPAKQATGDGLPITENKDAQCHRTLPTGVTYTAWGHRAEKAKQGRFINSYFY